MKVIRDCELCRAGLVNMVTACLSIFSVRVLLSHYKNAFLLYAFFLFNKSEGKLHWFTNLILLDWLLSALYLCCEWPLFRIIAKRHKQTTSEWQETGRSYTKGNSRLDLVSLHWTTQSGNILSIFVHPGHCKPGRSLEGFSNTPKLSLPPQKQCQCYAMWTWPETFSWVS